MGLDPKEALRLAKDAESKGQAREASARYADLAIFLRGAGKLSDAQILIARAIRLSPNSPRLYLQRAICEWRAKNVVAARESTEKFAEMAVGRKEKLAEYRKYAEAKLHDIPELREVFHETVGRVERTDARPFLAKARALLQQGEKEKALRTLVDALKTRTRDAEVFSAFKECLAARGDKDGLKLLARLEAGKVSRRDFASLILPSPTSDREPEAAPVDRSLGDLIHELESELGIDLEEKADSVKPLVKEFRRRSDAVLKGDPKSRMDMAMAFFEMGLLEDAMDELRRVPETDERFPASLILMGDILVASGSDLAALETLQRCLRDDRAPKGVRDEARYKLVTVYFRLGDFAQAVIVARELEKSNPGYRDIRTIRMKAEAALDQAPLRKAAK